jgi:ATP-dependent DNA helicase PIF1
MQFTQEQECAYEKYINHENIFITGPGGCGKSMFIKKIVNHARDEGIQMNVCAMTGCAATLLQCGAKTLHSWGGFGLAKGKNIVIAGTIADNRYKRKNWRKVDVLVVDEISMLSYKLFELMELTARKARKNDKLFGGIQVIFCGDFFQLPPVGDNDDIQTSSFCFESPLFDKVFPYDNKIQFTKIFRQSDPVYSKILNKIRKGKISKSGLEILKERIGKTTTDLSIRPTVIHPLKGPVEKINNNSLKLLPGEEKIFVLQHELIPDEDLTVKQRENLIHFNKTQTKNEFEYLEKNINCLHSVTLKVGAQVMCIVNIDMDTYGSQICNGSQGIITHFQHDTGLPVVKFNNGMIKTINYHSWISENIPSVSIKQIPLILAWAVTIHKVQGATIDLAEIDIGSGVFECGQTYVALSRVKNIEGLYLRSFDPSKIKINSKVQMFYENLNII